MSLSKENLVLSSLPEKELDWEWVGNERGDDKAMAARQKDMTVVGRVNDDQADYSYDDYALVLLDGEYYLFNTSGCSCPSPCETWGVWEGPKSLDDMEQTVMAACAKEAESDYAGVVGRQMDEFQELFHFARTGK